MITAFRPAIDKELHQSGDQPCSDAEWQWLDTQGHIRRISVGKMEPQAVAAVIRQLRAIYASHERPRPVSSEMQKVQSSAVRKAREELIAFLLSELAGRFHTVVGFRQQVLGGKLLRIDEVDSWIRERAQSERPTVWVEFAVLPEEQQLEKPFVLQYPSEHDFKTRWLWYALPSSAAKSVRTGAGGILEHLRDVSEYVAYQTGLNEANASTFVLTGETPPFYSCEKEISLASVDMCSALNRINLSLDPTLSPREVAEIYRGLRKQVFTGRFRAMSEKHIRLALFTWKRGNESLKEALSAWNKLYRKWRYRQESNFGRDRLAATRRAWATLDAPKTSTNALEQWVFGRELPVTEHHRSKKKTRGR